MRGLLPAAIVLLWAGATYAERFIPMACEPALKFYCANIHVGCAGRSKIETRPFLLEVNSRRGFVIFGGSTVEGRTTIDQSSIIYRPLETSDWIKVDHDSAFGPWPYASRTYRKGKPLMSRGVCWHFKAEEYHPLADQILKD